MKAVGETGQSASLLSWRVKEELLFKTKVERGVYPLPHAQIHGERARPPSYQVPLHQRWAKVRLSDPPMPKSIFRLYRPIFSQILELHIRSIAENWRILKRYNRFID